MMQSDFRYGELNGEMQKLAANMVSGLDFSALGLETEEDVQNYITNHILNPLYNAGPEVKDAIFRDNQLERAVWQRAKCPQMSSKEKPKQHSKA